MPDIPTGWYPDPRDPLRERLWDGENWLEHTRPRPPTPIPSDTESIPAPDTGDVTDNTVPPNRPLRSQLTTIRRLLLVLYALLAAAAASVLRFGSWDSVTSEQAGLVGVFSLAAVGVLMAIAGFSARTAYLSGVRTLHPAVAVLGVPAAAFFTAVLLFALFPIPDSLEHAFADDPQAGWGQSSVLLYCAAILMLSASILAPVIVPLTALIKQIGGTSIEEDGLGNTMSTLAIGAIALAALEIAPEFLASDTIQQKSGAVLVRVILLAPLIVMIGLDRAMRAVIRETDHPTVPQS